MSGNFFIAETAREIIQDLLLASGQRGKAIRLLGRSERQKLGGKRGIHVTHPGARDGCSRQAPSQALHRWPECQTYLVNCGYEPV